MKRREQPLLEGVPQPEFCSDATIEAVADVDAVGAFRGCGKPE